MIQSEIVQQVPILNDTVRENNYSAFIFEVAVK